MEKNAHPKKRTPNNTRASGVHNLHKFFPDVVLESQTRHFSSKWEKWAEICRSHPRMRLTNAGHTGWSRRRSTNVWGNVSFQLGLQGSDFSLCFVQLRQKGALQICLGKFFPFVSCFVKQLVLGLLHNFLELLAIFGIQTGDHVVQGGWKFLTGISCLRLVLWCCVVQHPQKIFLAAAWKQMCQDLLDNVTFHNGSFGAWSLSLFQLRKFQCAMNGIDLWEIQWQPTPKSWTQKITELPILQQSWASGNWTGHLMP